MLRFRPHVLLTSLCAMALTVTAHTAFARIYLGWGAAKSTTDALTAAGGTLAYEAEIRINSGAGHLYVFGFDGSLSEHLATLQRQFDAEALAPGKTGSSELRMVTLKRDEHVLRLVLVNLRDQDKSVVFAMEQSHDAFAQSGTAPGLVALQDVGPLPQADPVFYARDERVGMALVVLESNMSPIAMHELFSRDLQARGWTSALPELGAKSDSPERFGVYLKDQNTCVALSARDQNTGLTRITVLHKEPGIE